MRNSCRACRLKRCLHAGMRPDLARNARQDELLMDGSLGAGVVSLSCPSPPPLLGNGTQTVTLSFTLATPTCQQLANALRELEEGQKAVVAQHFGLSVAIGKSVRMITQSEAMQLQRCCVPLYIALVRAQFPQFDTLENALKADLMRKFMLHFNSLFFTQLTVRTCESPSSQCFMFPGCAVDCKNKCEDYFKTVTGVGRQQQIDLIIPLIDRYMRFKTDVYRPLGVSTLEFAALSGILLWNSVHQILGPELANGQREVLFGELHSLAIQHCLPPANPQPCSIPARFGQLLSLLLEFTSLDKDLGELFSLSKVFLDPDSSIDLNSVWEGIFPGNGEV